MNNSPHISFSSQNGVGAVTFSRPSKRNALTFEMYRELARIAEDMSTIPELRVVVISGEGGSAFTSGTDVHEFSRLRAAEDVRAYLELLDRVTVALQSIPVPVIAAISGACTGGGAAIAACCDVRIGSPSTRFGLPMARTLGNVLSSDAIELIAEAIGIGRVRELLLTARLMEVDEARACGWLHQVAADDDSLLEVAFERAHQIAALAPLALRFTKLELAKVRQGRSGDPDFAAQSYETADFHEGVAAFLEKRSPNWKGQ